jgi:hypothetical protein
MSNSIVPQVTVAGGPNRLGSYHKFSLELSIPTIY